MTWAPLPVGSCHDTEIAHDNAIKRGAYAPPGHYSNSACKRGSISKRHLHLFKLTGSLTNLAHLAVAVCHR